MNAVAQNVIPVDFLRTAIPVDARTATPVVVDFRQAATPQGDIAKRVFDEANAQTGKLVGADKKHGVLRVLASGRSDLFNLNPYLISIEDDWNCRDYSDPENLEHIDALARSIAKIGVMEPLTARLDGNKIVLTDGHMRWFGTIRAIEVYGAEIKGVQVRLESKYSNAAEHLARQLFVGKQKSPIEQGRVFVRLIRHGWTVPQIAVTVGLGPVRVNQILDFIADSSDAVKAMVVKGEIKLTEAEKVVRKSRGDTAAAEKTLAGAVKLAKAEGRKSATARHVRETSLSEVVKVTKAEVRAILAKKADTKGRNVNFTKDEWNKLLAL